MIEKNYNTTEPRDVFPFDINHMLYLDSNIFIGLVISKLLRIAKTKTDLINIVASVNLLLIRMKKHGSACVCFILLLKKILGKQFKVFHKFADTANEFTRLFSLQVIYTCLCTCIF